MEVHEWVYSGCQWFATGSYTICNPPVTDTDRDYVVLERLFDHQIKKLISLGFAEELGSNYEHLDKSLSNFRSFRKDSVNVLVTSKKDFFNRFDLATRVAKDLNLTEKKDRITLFKAILYGEHNDEVVL